MHRHSMPQIAIATLAATLAGGCSSMERAFDDVMDRSHEDQARVDLNSAGRKRLAALPGISDDEADRIVANRPYQNRRDLVRKNVLSQEEFERVRDSVYVAQEKD